LAPLAGVQKDTAGESLSIASAALPLDATAAARVSSLLAHATQRPVETCAQPVAGTHESVVHMLSSSQLLVPVPVTQLPALHLSPVVQALPSSQSAVLLAWAQVPSAGLQLSSVQTLSSLQLLATPTHWPAEHVSLLVHALPSSHVAVLFVWTQPVAGTQLSSVHGLVSAQLGGAPPWHAPAEHVSAVVQALPSSHEAVLFACWQAPPLHMSSVHGLLSLQSAPVVHSGGGASEPASVLGLPPVQTPPLHV
jgi:hypothetical protein